MTYDSGDFPALFEETQKIADMAGFEARKRESKTRGKLRGLGIGSFLEVTAPPGKEMGGIRFEAERRRHDHHRHARLRSGHADDRLRRCCRARSAFRSSASGCCRATAIS